MSMQNQSSITGSQDEQTAKSQLLKQQFGVVMPDGECINVAVTFNLTCQSQRWRVTASKPVMIYDADGMEDSDYKVKQNENGSFTSSIVFSTRAEAVCPMIEYEDEDALHERIEREWQEARR